MIKVYKKSYLEVFKFPYAFNALEPTISEKTNTLHYHNHFKTYVDKTTLLLDALNFNKDLSLTELVKASYGDYTYLSLYNNSAQILNHITYWNSLCSEKLIMPPNVKKLIDESFGSYDNFVEKIINVGTELFGNGWVWMILKRDGLLDVISTINAFNPISLDSVTEVLFALDLWEHAYYVDYTFKKRDHIINIINHINWNKINMNISAHIV